MIKPQLTKWFINIVYAKYLAGTFEKYSIRSSVDSEQPKRADLFALFVELAPQFYLRIVLLIYSFVAGHLFLREETD